MEVHATAALLLQTCQQIMLQGWQQKPACAQVQGHWHAVTPLLCRLQAKQARQQGADWMFGGSGAYAPHPGSSAVDMKLRLHETVSVFDIGLAPHPARALLDSGALWKQSLHGNCCY